MSLIQDALKRKSEETPVPAVPSPVVQSQSTRPLAGEKETKMPKIILLLLLLAVPLAIPISIHLIKQKPLKLPLVVKNPAPAAPAVPEPVVQALETVSEPVKKEESVPEIKPAWPEIELTGIASSESLRIAIINGKMLTAGSTVGEVIIREVHETEVVVEFQGERRIRHVDE